MHKMKYAIVSAMAILLILIISALPFGISSIQDHTTHGRPHQSNIDIILLNTVSNLTPIQKLQLIGQGGSYFISDDQATCTKEQVAEYAKESLERFTGAGLLDHADGDWAIATCEPVLYYDMKKAERYNIFWKVLMEDATNQLAELLIDDRTGEMYYIYYTCNMESMEENVSVSKTNVEHFATCYLGSISTEFSIDECRQTQDDVWMMTVACYDAMDEVIVELYLNAEKMYCTIY